jgi:hypothetical protein
MKFRHALGVSCERYLIRARHVLSNGARTLAHNSTSMSPTLVEISTRPLVGSDMGEAAAKLSQLPGTKPSSTPITLLQW